MKNCYCRIIISSMEYLVIPSLNTMQPAVPKIAVRPNNIRLTLILGNSMMMREVSYGVIFSNLFRNRHLACHQYSSIASSKLSYQISRSAGCEIFAKLQNMFCVISWKPTIRLMPNQLSTSFTPLSNL